jgi:hypothetical protein
MAYSDQQVADYLRTKGLAGNGAANTGGIYSAAQQYGVDASQLDRVGASQGWWGNTGATDWVTQHGLSGGLGTQPNAPTAGGAAASPAGGALAGSAYGNQVTNNPVAQPAGGGAAANPYMPTGGARQQNPYMPAGGQGSNYGADPRMGGPAQWGGMGGGPTGNQGLAGAADYLWQNPNTMAMGNELTRNVNDNLQRSIMPGIRGNAMAGGSVGGSRQGVAEGLATGESMKGLAGALAGLYGNQYNQDRNYGLQNDALDLSVYNTNQNWMRQGQQDQIAGMNGFLNANQQGLATAGQAQNTPFTNWNRFVGPASQMGGLGGSQSQNMQGNPYLGAIGGYMAGQKLFGG